MIFHPRRKNAGCLGLACLTASLVGAFVATRNENLTVAIFSCAAFVLFVILIGSVLGNQTIEIGDGFMVVRRFRRAVRLEPDDLVEVIKRRDGSLAYRFHAGGILHFQVSPLAYYHSEALQEHFDCIFDLESLGISIRELGRQH